MSKGDGLIQINEKDEGSNRWTDKDNEQMTRTGKVKLENNYEKKNVLCNKGSKN